MAAAPGFEKRDLLLALPARTLAAGELKAVGDLGFGNQAARQWLRDVAGMVGGGKAGIDENAGTTNGIVIGFAHVVAIAADEVEMLARPQPTALDQRLGRHGGG